MQPRARHAGFRLIAVLGLCLLTVGTASAAQPPADHLVNTARWAEHCTTLKTKLKASPVAYVTYTPLPPAPTRTAPAWRLTWHGLVIPVPELDYSRIGLLGDEHGVLLATRDNAYTIVDRAIELQPGNHRMPLLRALFGAHATLLDAIAYGYTVTPAALNCTAKASKQQLKLAMALALKTLPSPGTIRATHRLIGRHAGLLQVQQVGNGTTKYDYLIKGAATAAPVSLSYRLVGPPQATQPVGLLFARPGTARFTPPPAWFNALQHYLDTPEQRQLCHLASQLSLAHFTGRDVQRLLQGHPPCATASP